MVARVTKAASGMPERYNNQLLSGSFSRAPHRPVQVRPGQFFGKCPHSSVNPGPGITLYRDMSLTGTAFLYTLIVLSVVALVLPLALWSRLRGPRIARAAARVLMVLFAQGTAVGLVFAVVNNQNNLYDSWADLLGTGNHVQQAGNLGADGTGGIALKRLPRVRQHFTWASGPGMRGVRETQLKGRVSGVNAEVYVWLPPQYDEPRYRHHAFPVVELLPGYPGSAKAWFSSLRATRQLAPLMRNGE